MNNNKMFDNCNTNKSANYKKKKIERILRSETWSGQCQCHMISFTSIADCARVTIYI